MSGFDPAWLALREAADARSRAAFAPAQILEPRAEGRPLRILDLATGTGANLRYLAPRLGGSQEWLLTDADPRLLDTLPAVMERWASSFGSRCRSDGKWLRVAGPDFDCSFRSLRIDLSDGLGRLPIMGQALVTGSALLDLVSEQWVSSLVRLCRRAGASLLLSLTYDGRVQLHPTLRNDELVIGLVNRHQLTDKGFGPAMGPRATDITEAELLRRGYRVVRRCSDWRIGAEETELQVELLRGWAGAATAMAPEAGADVKTWYAVRAQQTRAGASSIGVGHQDLLATLA